MVNPQDVKPDEHFADIFLSVIRAEFDAPVKDLSDMVETLVDHAGDTGLEPYIADLDKLRQASRRLSGRVSELMNGGHDLSTEQAARNLRHDLRTPIAAVLGYGELIAEEAQDAGAEPSRQLADILSAAKRLLADLDGLVTLQGAAAAGEADKPDAVLPAMLRQAVAVADQLSRAPQSRNATVTGRILVVDDNESMRDLILRRLIREGHSVEGCDSGQVALELAATGAFDLMLLDLMMPGITGLDVLRELETQPGGRSLPVIVISAFDEMQAAVQCIEAGADDFLSKPLDETLLRARITSSLERKFLRDRSEMLLRNVLPAAVVERLRSGETVIADRFDDATVLFCDLVGFTAMSANLRPDQTLTILNDIFSGFDELADRHRLEKIKTIGDAYMLVGGIGMEKADHALRVVEMAATMPDIVSGIAGSRNLAVRIGIASGPVAAGIIGRRKFFYDVWGDTVNLASRLEEASLPGRIHVSKATRAAVGDRFSFEQRPAMDIRGKGMQQTYFLAPR